MGQALAGALTALVGLGACVGGEDRPRSTRTDSAGVEVVVYDGQDVALSWTFDSLFSLGGVEAGSQSFYELGRGAVGIDASGDIYVLDRLAKRIAVFDSLGADVRVMGRPGGGPGETELPVAMVVSPDGRAAAFDFGKRALVWFGPRGEVLDQEPSAGYFGGEIHSSGTALTFPSQQRDQSSGVPTDRLVRVEGGDTTVLVSQTNTEWKPVFFKSCGIGISAMPPVFSPSIRWAAAGDRVAVTTGAEYEVRLFTGTRTSHVVRRGIEPEPASTAAAEAELGPGMTIGTTAGKRVCDPEEVLEQRGFAERIPVITEIAAGPDGTWWVRRRGGGGALAFDIFAADGDYLGTLPASAPYPVVTMAGSRFASIVTDELEVDRLVVYRLRTGRDR